MTTTQDRPLTSAFCAFVDALVTRCGLDWSAGQWLKLEAMCTREVAA